jgi:hypothetical protein
MDHILSELQTEQPCHLMISERRLWVAVLEQAIIDLSGPNGVRGGERRRLRTFSRLWFTSDNDQPGSFLWVCESLQLDPSWVRNQLAAVIKAASVSRRPQFWHRRVRLSTSRQTGCRSSPRSRNHPRNARAAPPTVRI